MKTGSKVRVIPPAPIEGLVRTRRINPVSDETELLVEWAAGGESHNRWFEEKALELVPDEPEGEEQVITATDVGDAAAVLGGAK